jgi:hypothetical protein
LRHSPPQCFPTAHAVGAVPPIRVNNNGDSLSSPITLVDEVAFASLDLRLARRLLAEADAKGVVAKTHQQLPLDLGSLREVISRYLGEWERMAGCGPCAAA